MRKRSNESEFEVLERLLEGGPLPQADPVHPDTQDFADFLEWIDGDEPVTQDTKRRFSKFLPKRR